MKTRFWAGILFLMLPLQAWGQGHPGVDQQKVDLAIDKGIGYLTKSAPILDKHIPLVLYTFLHSGMTDTHPKYKEYLSKLLTLPLLKTYEVAIQAMFLAEYDGVTYQWRIAQCAQFLVDNQLTNGQWDYGKETHIPVNSRAFKPVKKKGKTKVRPRKIMIYPQNQRSGTGDNSNSQYAILGLRACIQSGVYPPKKTLDLSLRWWYQSQNRDGGWEYRTATQNSYGSMTAGAIGCVVILDYYLKRNWKRDPRVKSAMIWMTKNVTVLKNPHKPQNRAYYYYMYALERAGILSGVKKFGTFDWYRKGANQLIKLQTTTGAWGSTSQTCFSILFLRRGTPGLPGVATGR